MDASMVPLSCEHNGGQSGETMHCEEQLRTTLHCDDKEKLRRKLALLQREYLRTAERLQRAERLDAVSSRISRQDRRDPEVTSSPGIRPSPLMPDASSGTSPSVHQRQGGAPADSEASRRSQVIRLLLPSVAASPQTPDLSHDPARGHRPSPALRLRSQRSRLLWERRSAEAGRSTDDNSEERQQPSERMETVGAEGSEDGVKTKEAEVVNESEELFSCDDSESPSLLLAHWDPDKKGNEKLKKKDGELTCWNAAVHPEEREQGGAKNGRRTETRGGEEGGNSRDQRDGRLREHGSNKDAGENAAVRIEREKGRVNTAEIKEDKGELAGGARDVTGAGLEGLLYPAEYYVRTTRRMTLSQSQPDMQAVTLSQLSMGRRRRSRGGGSNRRTHGREGPDGHSPTGLSSPTAEQSSASSREISGRINTEGCFPPAVAAARPARGGRKRRGRGRGRPRTPRCPVSSHTRQQEGLGQTSGDPDPISSPVSSSRSLHGADGPKPGMAAGGGAPAQDDPDPASTATPPSSGQRKTVFPIFLKRTDGCRRTRSAASWRSLLLPSPPPATPPPPPPSSLFPGPLLNNVANFDIPQDFHLPDEQFASLKLHKLRQVAVDSGVEHFTSPSCNTRGCNRRRAGGSCPVSPLPLPLSLTPTISKETPRRDVAEIPGEPQMGIIHPAPQTRRPSTESVSVVPDCAADCVDQREEQDAVSVDHPVQRPLQLHSDYIPRPSGELQMEESSVMSSEEPTAVLEDLRSGKYSTQDQSIIRTLSFDCLLQKTPEEPSSSCPAAELRNDSGAPGEREKSPAEESEENSEPAISPPTNQTRVRHRVPSQLLQSPPLASAPGPSMAPHLASSSLLSSPTLPSLGLSPHPLRTAPPPTSSPAALSPPEVSPLPPGPPSQPTAAPTKASSEPSCTDHRSHGVEPPRPQASGGRVETAEEHMMRCTHTLKAPAGGCLMDACCLRGSSGALCVAAAGAWAVCLWSQTSADWTLTHTWAFDKPVINVFPVPGAAGLLCVTLGQLEIREVRTLSCSALSQALLCEGVVQAIVGVSRSRVVTSSHSASGSSLRVFTPSHSGSTSIPLVSPGVCVGALAPVDALPDALIGSSESGHLFVWNLKTGQLLRRIILEDGLSHMACLRGFSSCGVLFVLLQHQLLSSLEDEATEKDEDRTKAALFSLVAVNPLSGKSTLASRLHPPRVWSGRLSEADASGCSVVGVSQSGCVCVWGLGHRGASRTVVRAPGGEGWQLARWGEGGTLVTGHHNGDVTLHCPGQTSLCDRPR